MSTTFDATSTAAEVAAHFAASIKGKNVIVTGVSLGGLGGEAARVIASNGAALVVLAGRGQAKLDEIEATILAETPKANLRKLVIDLASLASVRTAAAEVNAYSEKIDVLINNAAIMGSPYARTTDGFESQFGTNHLGPFLFTNLIKAKFSPSSRVVNVASNGHMFSEPRFDDVSFGEGKNYDKWAAYGQGKTANILFAVALADKWAEDGVTAFSLHPGVIRTNLGRSMTHEDLVALGVINPDGTPSDNPAFEMKTLGQGAATHIVAAFDPAIKSASGSYLLDCQLHNEEAKPYAIDHANAEKLWVLSEKLVGLSA